MNNNETTSTGWVNKDAYKTYALKKNLKKKQDTICVC